MVIRRKKKFIVEENIFEARGTWIQSKLSFILWYYTMSQFSLTRFNLLSCDNSSIFISRSLQHSSWLCVISIRHGYQTIKWPLKNSHFLQELFSQKERAIIPQMTFKNKWKCPLVKGVFCYLLCSPQQQLIKPETKCYDLEMEECHSSSDFNQKNIFCSSCQW